MERFLKYGRAITEMPNKLAALVLGLAIILAVMWDPVFFIALSAVLVLIAVVELREVLGRAVSEGVAVRFLNDEKALTEMPSILAALALGLVIFLAIVIVGGLIIGNFLAVGQDSLANLNTTTANMLQTTWDNLVSVYAMFGTWSPIIFIALFAVLVITAVVGLRGVGGGRTGGGF